MKTNMIDAHSLKTTKPVKAKKPLSHKLNAKTEARLKRDAMSTKGDRTFKTAKEASEHLWSCVK